jgi:hypothetical protein
MSEEIAATEASTAASPKQEGKGEVVVEIRTSFKLDETMLQCLNKEGLTTTSITVT